MEEFNDASSFVLAKEMSAHSVYELNTSIFDRDSFIFTGTEIGSHSSGVENNFVVQNSDPDVFSSDTDNGNASNYEILSYDSPRTSLFNMDNSATNLNSSKQYSNVSSSNEGFHQISNVLEGSEVSGICHESTEGQPNVLVIINLKASNTHGNVEASSTTDQVVDLESENFNILDLVANEDITSVSPEDIFATPSTPNSHVCKYVEPSEGSNKYLPDKKPRKRRKYTDISDDVEGDFVQATKSATIISAGTEYKVKYTNNGCNKEYDLPSGSNDSFTSNYRELRDKKNEASRKSSLKRKIKDLELKREAEELLVKNIKLKAHVEQLEQIVTNYRENLFKMNKK